MSALTRHLEHQKRLEREAWRSGFMVGCLAGFFTLAPIILLVLLLR
jgi:hypothetical protein